MAPGRVAVSGADEQLERAARALAERAAAVLPRWLRARAGDVVRAAGGDRQLADRARPAAEAAASAACQVLFGLAATDLDAQRTTPLAAVRAACAPVTALLRDAGLPTPPPAPGAPPEPAADPYSLAPPSWDAVDPQLAELALVWGAAKAAAHLDRRRPR